MTDLSASNATSLQTVKKQLFVGVIYGCAELACTMVFQKICMIAGVIFKVIEEEAELTTLYEEAIKWPIAEEYFFRGILQPLVAKGIGAIEPRLKNHALYGIPYANIISSAVCGIGFGALHYFSYVSGGIPAAIAISASGIFYGVMKERFGLLASIFAHMTHSFGANMIDRTISAFEG